MKVTCKACSNFRQGSGSDMALGRCLATPHDGHVGQWPYRLHPCSSFMSVELYGTSEAPKREWPYYLKELRSTECQCGQEKTEGRSFCYGCWKKLPEELRKPLYKRIGDGYEQAYERACQCLDM